MTDFTAKAEELVKTWRGDGCYTGTYYELAAQVAAALEAAYAQGVEDAAKVAGAKDHEALEKIAAEHEKQASAWADGGEPDHAQWHRRLAKIAKEALK